MKIILFLLCFVPIKFYTQSHIPEDYKMVFNTDFESLESITRFEITDKGAWRIGNGQTGKTLELYKASNYKTRVRSPLNIALINNVVVGDFILEVELNQKGKEYGHRDLCLFFGFNNPTNFYYVHIASEADDHANNIFLVNDEPRIKISTKTTKGTDWGSTDSWHKVRIERVIKSGSIKVYFDDMVHPIMEANDNHFVEGYVGIGSFDDVGQFDNLKVWSNGAKNELKTFFTE